MEFGELRRKAVEFAARLDDAKASTEPPEWGWYPYKMLPGMIDNIGPLLDGEHGRLFDDPAGRRVADVGAADGDFGFFLESLGFDVDLVDGGDATVSELRLLPPRRLKEALGSKAGIYGVDLDHDFDLRGPYDLIFFFGVLYHLRNPFIALDVLSRSARHCFLSTKVANRLPADTGLLRRSRLDVSGLPVAYLLDAYEANPHDTTNFWVFSEAGLRRILKRAGWEVLGLVVAGNPGAEPASRDEARAWCLLRAGGDLRARRPAPYKEG